MDRWKAEQGRGREKRKIRRKKSKKTEDADAWKGRKVAKHCVFPMIWGSGGSKSRLAKAAGAEPAGQMRDEQLHAVVARSTFPSQNVQSTPLSDHFWKLRCRKSARRCGAKHISKSKCTKHTSVGPLLEVEMSKKWTPLWREAHKCTKHTMLGPLLGVQTSKKCMPLWRGAHFEVKMLKALVVRTTRGSDHFWRFRCPFASLHYTTLHYTTLHSTTLRSTTLHYITQNYNYNYTPLHSTTLLSSTLYYATLHYATLHYTPLH